MTVQRALELDITYACSMGCVQCNRVLGLIPSSDAMTVDQVGRILHESASLVQPYLEIRVLGGEPTLHPHLIEVVRILDWYRNQVSGCSTSLWTHGCGESVSRQLARLPSWIKVHVSPKSSKLGGESFETFLTAPLDYEDLHAHDYWNGCGQVAPGKCGVGVSPYGIYTCPPSAAIDRVVGLDIGLKSLRQVCDEEFAKQCQRLCRYCGHFLVDRGIKLPIQTVSDTWLRLREQFEICKPQLTRY